MNSKTKLLIVILIFVVIIVGAFYATQKLDKFNSVVENNSDKSGNTSRPNTSGTTNGNNAINDVEESKINFTVYDKNGKEVKLSDFKGKGVVINVWSVTCIYCIEEMPYFEDAYKNYSDVEFLMITPTYGKEANKEVTREYISDNKYTFNVYYDDNDEMYNKYKITGFPTTIFIDKEGNVSKIKVGAITESQLKSYIENIR